MRQGKGPWDGHQVNWQVKIEKELTQGVTVMIALLLQRMHVGQVLGRPGMHLPFPLLVESWCMTLPAHQCSTMGNFHQASVSRDFIEDSLDKHNWLYGVTESASPLITCLVSLLTTFSSSLDVDCCLVPECRSLALIKTFTDHLLYAWNSHGYFRIHLFIILFYFIVPFEIHLPTTSCH